MSLPPGPDPGLARLVRRLDAVLLAGLLLCSALAALALSLRGSDGTRLALLATTPPTATPSPTPTATATRTPPPTATRTPRPSPTPSRTLPPSRTPTPPPPPRVEPLNLTGIYAGTRFTVRGTGTPGHTIALYDNDILLATTRVSASGRWQIVVPGLSVGAHALVVVAIGPQGNSSEPAPVGFAIVHAPTATASATASPTRTPSATAATATDTATRTPRPTQAPASPTPTAGTPQALLVTASATARRVQPSRTPTPPATATATVTASATATRTRTPTAIPSATPTRTPPPSPTRTPRPPTATPTRTPAPTPAPPVILDPSNGDLVAAGAVPFSGRGEPGGRITLADDAGNLVGAGTAGAGGQWRITADLSPLQGEVTIAALLVDARGMVLAQSAGVRLTVVPQLAPPTGAELPGSEGPRWLDVGLILTAIVGLALLVGGLALRQAGRLLRMGEGREEDDAEG